MTNRPYKAYLLRLWQSGDPDQPGWRASLEEPHTRQITGFNSLEALNEYLRRLVDNIDAADAASYLSSHKIPKKEFDHETK